MKEKVWTGAGPPEIGPSSICLQMHGDCLLSWLPRRCMRDHWTLSMRGMSWVCDRLGLGRCDMVAQVWIRDPRGTGNVP